MNNQNKETKTNVGMNADEIIHLIGKDVYIVSESSVLKTKVSHLEILNTSNVTIHLTAHPWHVELSDFKKTWFINPQDAINYIIKAFGMQQITLIHPDCEPIVLNSAADLHYFYNNWLNLGNDPDEKLVEICEFITYNAEQLWDIIPSGTYKIDEFESLALSRFEALEEKDYEALEVLKDLENEKDI